MAMRRRHVASPSKPARPTTTAADDSKARRELHGRQPTTGSCRSPESSRFLLFVTVGLCGVVIVCVFLVTRSSDAIKPGLPAYFALCSKERRVYTSNPSLPNAECVVVEDGVVLDVGSLMAIRAKYGDADTLGRVRMRKGRALKVKLLKKDWSVVPGLIDAHAHPLGFGEARTSVDLVGSRSPQEVVERIVAHVDGNLQLREDPSAFILGIGWDQTLFPSRSFPVAADLATHPLLVGRRIVLTRIDVHAYWVSPAVIALAGDLPETVEGGTIFRTADGKPTGIFLDNAMPYILNVIPPWTDADRLSFLRTAASHMLQTGLTAVHDAAATPETIKLYRRLDAEGRLPVRIYAMVDCGWEVCTDRVEKYEGDRLSVRSVKMFADGALGSWGAAMWEPYTDDPSTRGLLRAPEASFLPFLRKWSASGFSVHVHAIGDRANSLVIDAFETVIAEHPGWQGRNSARFRIEHAQILRKGDIERMGRLGIIASVQPTHATADMWYAQDRLGPERILGAYAWQDFFSHNVPIALGSDFPVSPVSPLLGLHAAATRLSEEGTSPHGPEGWYASQKLSPTQALHGFTRDAAFAAGWEDKVGTLEKGKKADMVVLEGDVVRQDVGGPLKARVRATIIDGMVAFGGL